VSNNNSIPKFAKCQEGGRIALLPQKTRKIYSYKQLKKALSEGLRIPAAVPVSRFQFFVKKDGQLEPVQAEPVGAFVGSDPRTIKFYLELAEKHNWAVLYQGTILITKKIAEELRENRRIAKGDWEKIAQLDQRALFGKEVVRLAYRVLIDIDKKDEVAIRRLVKYLWKLKVYPEVWETQNGYHFYFYFYYRKVYQEIRVEDEDGKERVEKVLVGYELPYADDYRIKDIEECLKVLCAKLNIKPDIVSAKHAVWLEGFPNPLKDGFATKLVFTGFPLPLQDLWKKLLKVNPAKVRQAVRQNKPRYYRERKPKEKDTDKKEEALRELNERLSGEHSSVFHALNQHGTLIACRKLWKAGYSVDDIKRELEKRLDIRTKDEKYLQKFLAYFEKNYTTPTHRQESPPKEEEHKEEPKHEHYWELAEKVKEALEKGYRKTTHIAQYVGCSRDRVKHFKSFLQKHGYSLEDLLTRHEEVLAFLKAHAKGGNKWKRKKEWDREAWLEEFHRTTAEYIKQRKREAEIRRAKKRAELKEQGVDPDGWVHAPVWFLPVESGHIGDIRVYFGMAADGFSLTNRPPPHEKGAKRTDSFKTPAVPLVLPHGLTPSLQESLFDLLKRHHSEDGLPVVLVVPKRVSTVRGTILQLTPYKVPPRSFKQLWKEIKEKFGKLVQGLSTKNGALDWFLRAWDKLKEDPRGWIVVGSSPFSSKKNLSSSELSTLLSLQAELSNKLLEKLSTLQTEPSYKLSEGAKSSQSLKLALPIGEFATLENLFKAHSDKKIAELMPYMSEKSRQLFEQVQLVLKGELARLYELKERGELSSALCVVEKTESIIRLLEDRFLGLLSLSFVVFHRLLDTVLRNIEKICGDVMLFSGWESLTATDLLRKLSSADTYDEFLRATAELRKKLSTEQQTFLEFLKDIDLIREKLHAQQQEKLSAKKKANKKSGFPSSQVVQTALKFLEERTQGSDVVKVSREELETAIYTAWKNADPEKANRKAVSEYIDKYEGVLWKKLNNGHYVLLVSSDQVITRIRDYVRELKQAKEKGQPHTNGKGSVGSTAQLFNEKDGKSQPSANGNSSLGSQSSNGNNGNGKYDIDQIIHTLRKEGKVYVPPQFVHEIVRELRRRGLSVSYWTTTGLIELAGGDDEIPF
jgi:hypothetical protein